MLQEGEGVLIHSIWKLQMPQEHRNRWKQGFGSTEKETVREGMRQAVDVVKNRIQFGNSKGRHGMAWWEKSLRKSRRSPLKTTQRLVCEKVQGANLKFGFKKSAESKESWWKRQNSMHLNLLCSKTHREAAQMKKVGIEPKTNFFILKTLKTKCLFKLKHKKNSKL